MAFRCNVGGAERAGRIAIGLALIALAAFEVFSGTLRIAGFVVGGILFLTGAIGWCLMNALFGISPARAARRLFREPLINSIELSFRGVPAPSGAGRRGILRFLPSVERENGNGT